MNGIIFYDKQCDFCKKMIPFLDLESSYELIDLNDTTNEKVKKLNITFSELKNEIHLQKYNNQVFKGGMALLNIMKDKGYLSKLLHQIGDFKPVQLFFIIIYKIISNQRPLFNNILRKINIYSLIQGHTYLLDIFSSFTFVFLSNLFIFKNQSEFYFKKIFLFQILILIGHLGVSLAITNRIKIAPLSFLGLRVFVLSAVICHTFNNLINFNLTIIQLLTIFIVYLKIISSIHFRSIFYILKLCMVIIATFFYKSTIFSGNLTLIQIIYLSIAFYTPSKFLVSTDKNQQLLTIRDFLNINSNLLKVLFIAFYISFLFFIKLHA